MDENQHSSRNNANYQNASTMPRTATDLMIDRAVEARSDNGYGFNVLKITDGSGKPLKYTINKTMMRVKMPAAFKPRQKFTFNRNLNYKIAELFRYGGRGGADC